MAILFQLLQYQAIDARSFKISSSAYKNSAIAPLFQDSMEVLRIQCEQDIYLSISHVEDSPLE